MRRYYNKGSLVGGQVKLDKMGNNDGKISGEDFAVIRSKKMGGGSVKRMGLKHGSDGGQTLLETIKNFPKNLKNGLEQILGGEEYQKKYLEQFGKDKKKPQKKSQKKANGGMMEEAKEINSKIKNSRTLKMGGGMMKRNMYKAGSGKDTHVTKDGRTVKKGLYYYMNRAKKNKTSKPGKGTVTDKALKASAKTAKKPTKKA